MKTFRWTFPEPWLSTAEKESHEAFRERKSRRDQLIENPDSPAECPFVEIYRHAQNPVERWAVRRIAMPNSQFDIYHPIIFAAFWTLITHGTMSNQFVILIWFIAITFFVWKLTDHALAKTIRRAMAAKNRNDEHSEATE